MSLTIPSFALLTDLYQLTMAQGYWRLGMHNRQAVFQLFFRELPFAGGYAIACGLADIIEVIENYQFTASDLDYLASLPAPNGLPAMDQGKKAGSSLFQSDFLKALSEMRLSIHLDAVEEGTPIFPNEPLLRVQGPLWQCQLLETVLLNIVNFSTLIATKASRVCSIAGGQKVIEFGLRRAQGPNGGLMASRAAFIGGVSATSNVLAGQQYGIPLRGTHAHSWIMAFDSEVEAFEAYAKALPNNCVFLVDTYQTLQGVQHAIEVGKKLQAAGHPFLGIRLDSGDLAKLSIAARDLLDKAGFRDTKILVSSDLDEYVIKNLIEQGAKVDYWGVGTRLVTGYDQPALGGVYKLVSVEDAKRKWQNKSKQTDNPSKKTIAGSYGIRRIEQGKLFLRDELYKIDPLVLSEEMLNTAEGQPQANEALDKQAQSVDLLKPIFRFGKKVYNKMDIFTIQQYKQEQFEKLPDEFKALTVDNHYPINWV